MKGWSSLFFFHPSSAFLAFLPTFAAVKMPQRRSVASSSASSFFPPFLSFFLFKLFFLFPLPARRFPEKGRKGGEKFPVLFLFFLFPLLFLLATGSNDIYGSHSIRSLSLLSSFFFFFFFFFFFQVFLSPLPPEFRRKRLGRPKKSLLSFFFFLFPPSLFRLVKMFYVIGIFFFFFPQKWRPFFVNSFSFPSDDSGKSLGVSGTFNLFLLASRDYTRLPKAAPPFLFFFPLLLLAGSGHARGASNSPFCFIFPPREKKRSPYLPLSPISSPPPFLLLRGGGKKRWRRASSHSFLPILSQNLMKKKRAGPFCLSFLQSLTVLRH